MLQFTVFEFTHELCSQVNVVHFASVELGTWSEEHRTLRSSTVLATRRNAWVYHSLHGTSVTHSMTEAIPPTNRPKPNSRTRVLLGL